MSVKISERCFGRERIEILLKCIRASLKCVFTMCGHIQHAELYRAIFKAVSTVSRLLAMLTKRAGHSCVLTMVRSHAVSAKKRPTESERIIWSGECLPSDSVGRFLVLTEKKEGGLPLCNGKV
jgi:hypothetical protein